MDKPVTKPPADTDWAVMPAPCDFARLIGPIEERRVGGRTMYRMRVEPRHRNSAGTLHGGALAALIDETIGSMVHEALGGWQVTLRVTTSFLEPVRVGDMIEPDCEIVRTAGGIAFVEARLRVGERVVATASLVFKAMPAG
jgi:uncharacterized protein (TIGR00369 family)